MKILCEKKSFCSFSLLILTANAFAPHTVAYSHSTTTTTNVIVINYLNINSNNKGQYCFKLIVLISKNATQIR